MTRVVLVELIAVDRFHRAISFPFVHGYLRQRQVSTQWLRLGLPADWRAAPASVVPDLDRLQHAIVESGATHLLFNQYPGDRFADGLAVLDASPEVALLAEGRDVDGGGWPTVASSQSSLDGFVGLDSAPDGYPLSLFDAVAPDFSWEAVNDAAAEAPSLPFLICGDECNYRRKVTRNPVFRELDLSDCTRAEGCAFCVRPDGRAAWQSDVLTLARRQLTALTTTHPPSTQRLQIRAVGAPVLGKIEEFAELVRELELPAADFLLDARADTLVAARPAMERALRTLAGTQYRLHVALIGIESFVDRELQRLNKGTTWRHNLAAIQTLFELEHDFPEQFAFREHGGLSLLLYTPWTALEDLALNLAVIAFCDIADLCGKLFTSRLRLYPSIPLGQLAIRDGLVREAYDDPLLDTARRNFYPDELPWRFAHPVLEAVNRVVLRLAEPGADVDSEALRQLQQRVPAAREHVRLALALVDAAIQHPEATEPTELIDAASDLLGSVSAQGAATSGSRQESATNGRPIAIAPRVGGWRAPPEGLADSHVRHVAAVNLGLKPVARIEAGNYPEDGHRLWIEQNVPFALYREDHDGNREMFIGGEHDAVARALRATAAQRDAPNEEAYAGATREVGALLGYPACCTEAYLRHDARERESYTWLHLMARLAAGEVVPALSNPGREFVEHVPCSPGCDTSLANAAALLEAIGEIRGQRVVDDLSAQLESPWLFLIDYQGEAIELCVDGDPQGRFRYASGARRGDQSVITRVAEGDEMVIEEQQLYVLRNGRLHVALGGRAFVWYHRAVIQRDFWQGLVDLKFGCRRLSGSAQVYSHPSHEGISAAAPHTSAGRHIATLIEAALAEADAPRDFFGFRVSSIEQTHHTRVSVVLARPDGVLRLLVAPSRRAEHAYAREGAVAVMTERGEQVDSNDKDGAVRAFTRALGARVTEEQLLREG